MANHPVIAASGHGRLTAYHPHSDAPMAHIFKTPTGLFAVTPDDGLLPYGSSTPEYSALFPNIAEALGAVFDDGEEIWNRFDPTPLCVSRETLEKAA